MTAEPLAGTPQPPPAHDPQLTLAGVSRDGTRLVLVSRSGAEYVLPVDARLRAAVRGDSSGLGQLEMPMDSTLRPRDIQARIRSGETPEAVATAGRTTIEKIMPYAAPVLAEREHITQRAQRSSLRRPGGTARTLGDAVAAHLRALDVDPATLTWDAWRREDGRWTLTAAYATARRSGTGTFTYDAPGNFVVLEDDHAQWLVGDLATDAAPAPTTGAASSPGARRGLSAVPSTDDLGHERPIEAFLDDRPGVDESELREQAADAAALDRTPAELARDRAEDAAAAGTADAPAAADEAAGAADQAARPGAARDDEPAAPPARRSRKKGARASVPSWDEIMFGGGGRD